MTTADWLRSKIGPSPNPAPPEHASKTGHPTSAFFTRYLRPEMRVLHAYCGQGKATLALATFVPLGEVTGIDPHIDNLRSARARRYVQDGGEVSFERAALADLPFGPGEFDAAYVDGPLATEESPERALHEVMRVLIPGGLLGARHTAAASRVLTADHPLIERALQRQDAVMRDLGGDPDAGLKQPELLREAGYVNVRVTSSTEQKSGEALLEELSRDGFVPAGDMPGPEDEDAALWSLFSFVTAVESVCWKPA